MNVLDIILLLLLGFLLFLAVRRMILNKRQGKGCGGCCEGCTGCDRRKQNLN